MKNNLLTCLFIYCVLTKNAIYFKIFFFIFVKCVKIDFTFYAGFPHNNLITINNIKRCWFYYKLLKMWPHFIHLFILFLLWNKPKPIVQSFIGLHSFLTRFMMLLLLLKMLFLHIKIINAKIGCKNITLPLGLLVLHLAIAYNIRWLLNVIIFKIQYFIGINELYLTSSKKWHLINFNLLDTTLWTTYQTQIFMLVI